MKQKWALFKQKEDKSIKNNKKILILTATLIANLIACFAAITILLTVFFFTLDTFIDWRLNQEEYEVKLTFIEELTSSIILTERLFTKALFTVILASVLGVKISDEISKFVVTMTKKQKWALFICGLLLFLIGSVFNVHDIGYNDWSSDNGITLIYSGFKLCFLNKQLAFFEISSVWYFLFDFILGVFQLIGLIFAIAAIAFSLREHFRKRKENKSIIKRSDSNET